MWCSAQKRGSGSFRVRFATFVLLALAVIAGLSVRTASFQNFRNPDGGFFFYSVDAYEHLRRVTLGIYSFPEVPSFDFYAGFPRGTGQIWSPLYDYLLSAVSVLLGGSRVVVETVCFFANPFYAALTIIAIFFVARRLFSSDAAGIAASFLLALSPGHISYSLPMNFDHHVFEPMAVLLLLSLLFLEKNERLPLKAQVISVTVMVLAIFMWRGSALYWGMSFFAVLARSMVSGNRGLAMDYSHVYGGAALLLGALCIADPWGSASGISFGIISWFHVILLAIFSLLVFLAALSGGYRRFILLTGALVLAGGAGLLIFGPLRTFVSELGSGFLFFRRSGDAWLEFNSELRGVFSRHEFLFTAGYLTAAWFATPFAFVAALRNWQKGGRRDTGLITFAVWGPLFLLGLILRYVPIAGVIAAMGGGYLFSLAWDEGKDAKKRALLAAVALALFIIPSYPHYKNTVAGSLPAFMRYGLFGRTGVLEWIRDNTPKTSYYLNPVSRPEYGVLTNWDLGARVYQVAERPSMVTAFGWESHGLYEQAGFMVTPHPEMAEGIVRENGIRYILLKAFTSLDRSYRVAAEGERKGRLPEGITRGYTPGLSIYWRLFSLDGSSFAAPDVFVPALGSYRLLFETDYTVQGTDPGSAVSFFKVFEKVKGARITGRGKPEGTVSLRLSLSTSRGRIFTYHATSKADREGHYGFTVPYSTQGRQGATVPLGEYVVSGDGVKEVKVKVSEADVAEGRTIFPGHR